MRHRCRIFMFWRMILCVTVLGLSASCARLPYTTNVVHEDARVVVVLQRDVDASAYSHPVKLTPAELTDILQGFSFRPKQRMPLRWFAEENPPKPVFRQDELDALVGRLSEGLRTAGPGERVHFELRAPGFNPSARRDVVGGWAAVRERYLYVTLEYVHVQIPTRKADLYDYNYPTPPPPPVEYLLYFEPGRFWVTDPNGLSALDYRAFLNAPKVRSSPGP
ncbi:hypothetical protein [Nitrospira lenta]|uniref:Lipoprotein n=1 Tax=Nitrospira lenta TaxID=1436998 RepID=A0A330L304_9BACT|nr:hypothetical protein [Nitrospira lenta]SPP64189.1 conserved exported hypothetical protein [Nitrospira lenta]